LADGFRIPERKLDGDSRIRHYRWGVQAFKFVSGFLKFLGCPYRRILSAPDDGSENVQRAVVLLWAQHGMLAVCGAAGGEGRQHLGDKVSFRSLRRSGCWKE